MADSRSGTLSVVIPVYNEVATVAGIVEAVQAVRIDSIDMEIVVVNDCSSDGTAAVLEELERQHPNLRVFHHAVNQGKGAALRTGFSKCTGDWVIIQDADLEYDPNEYYVLLEPVLTGKADVVYGSRFLGTGAHRVVYYWHYMGNRFLTTLSNMFTTST